MEPHQGGWQLKRRHPCRQKSNFSLVLEFLKTLCHFF
jgi:hypothetical protein